MFSAYSEEMATFWFEHMPDGFDSAKVSQLHYSYDEDLKILIQWTTAWKDRERIYV